LLTLRPAMEGKDRQEILHHIASAEPTALHALNRAVPPDVETIILKALSKEPADRYATARELADDLCRFLADRPIVAKRPALPQRAAKWARCHKSFVATAAGVLVLATLGSAASTVLVGRERAEAVRQRDEAQLQRERAEVRSRLARQAVDEMYLKVAEIWL